jgi:hypothetical protein
VSDGLTGGGWLDVHASASRAGSFVALEQELHVVVGELAAASEGDATLCCYLAAACMAHAWRAAQWEELLPVSAGLPGRGELVGLVEEDAEMLAGLRATPTPTATPAATATPPAPTATPAPAPAPAPARMRGPAPAVLAMLLDDVYAPLIARYERTAATSHRVSDGPAAVAAGRCACDLRRVASEGESLRRSMYGDGGARGDRRGEDAAQGGDLSP